MAGPRRVWLAQCLCPQRHTILAAAGEADDEREADDGILSALRTQVADMLAYGVFNPWCGICKSPSDNWLWEVGRTSFATMAEAEPVLRDSERSQAIIRELFGEPG